MVCFSTIEKKCMILHVFFGKQIFPLLMYRKCLNTNKYKDKILYNSPSYHSRNKQGFHRFPFFSAYCFPVVFNIYYSVSCFFSTQCQINVIKLVTTILYGLYHIIWIHHIYLIFPYYLTFRLFPGLFFVSFKEQH